MNDTELRINLKALKKVDPYIISIEAHSSQVALYKFHPGKGDWEKTEVEGTLFVYQREAEPQYGFTIMNRLNMDNLVEPVTKELDFQLQTPFLLYRNHAGDIYGIWFYEQAECERVGKKIEMLVKGVEKKAASKQKHVEKPGDLQELFKKAEDKERTVDSCHTSTDTGKNLLRLLSQNDQISQEQNSHVKPSEKTTSVQDFFAMASSNDIQSSSPQMGSTGSSAFTSVPAQMTTATMMSQGHPSVPITALPISQGLAMGAVPVAGYPNYPVQQQMIQPTSMHTGQIAHAGGSLIPQSPSTTVINPVVQRLMSNPGIHSVESIEAEQRRSSSPQQVVVSSSNNGGQSTTKKITDLESDLKEKLHIGAGNSSKCLLSEHPMEISGDKQLSRQSLNSHQPMLLSPQVFASAKPSENSVAPKVNGHKESEGSISKPSFSPLTQPQMVEAVSYLLENDPEFVHKLHQAYIMSVNRKFQMI